MPYHALSYSERETYNARRRLLAHMGDVVRQKCIERERKRLEDELVQGLQCKSPKYDLPKTCVLMIIQDHAGLSYCVNKKSLQQASRYHQEKF